MNLLKSDLSIHTALVRKFSREGVSVTRGDAADAGNILGIEAAGLISQLEDESYAVSTGDGHLISWTHLYPLLALPDYAEMEGILKLPPLSDASPRLVSRGSLTDPDFVIAFDGWHDSAGRLVANTRLDAGRLWIDQDAYRLALPVWKLVEAVRSFAVRDASGRTEPEQRRAWGEIRAAALAAGAHLDDFLLRTVVLAPEQLKLNLRSSELHGARVVEIEPTFGGAPSNWVGAFDRSAKVLERYDLPTADGIVQVLISPAVRSVLAEIKRMPGRRVAGARAEAFLVNPVAALGEAAAEVLDSDQFETAKEQAGIIFDRFVAFVDRDSSGRPSRIGLVVTPLSDEAGDASVQVAMDDDAVVEFTERVASRLASNLQLCAWEDFEFELDGDSELECRRLLDAVAERAQPTILISHTAIYDLSGYSERIEGIGVEAPFYSPFIARKSDDEGWFPKNIVPIIGWRADGAEEPIAAPLTDELRREIGEKVAAAKATGKSTIELDGFPRPMDLVEAEQLLEAFDGAFAAAAAGKLQPDKEPTRKFERKALLLKGNIDRTDYVEARHAALMNFGGRPELPSTLKQDVVLKDHQIEGVAWLQHLFGLAPTDCRGALLADDMGLGKTLQLLCLIAAAREANPALPPALVVAPLSLLENWKEEVERFFKPQALSILTAYGDGLTSLRVPRSAIDEQLRQEGLVKFLKPGWRGSADIVLTTYETLRDMEFSFARETWSIMVCDEAQKIKNPSAAMTRAAKKQRVQFRIACTGTPVENSLTDLWCLFDFVQPGLLGALNEFGREYRRPIEAQSDEELQKVEELRMLIEPQILRRMKRDVAKDLPAKLINAECMDLPISDVQRLLYGNAIESFRQRREPGASSPFSNHLGLLHYLRLVCTDPKRPGLDAFVPEPIERYGVRAPKLRWLIEQLTVVKGRGEKAIIFCEFRNIQRLLRHYVEQAFGLAPDIINGDTSASAASADSRQKRIKAFQEKPGFSVIILSPVAVGFGVNIQAANHVIHYTRTWNPAKEDQASDRAYRIGQTRDVHVYYPTVRAPDFKTFDVRLDELLSRKRALAGDMLNGTGDLGAADFEIDEIAPEDAQSLGDDPIDIQHVLSMNGREFECFVAAYWSKLGHQYVELTPASSDGGVDVVALTGGSGLLVQCKSSTTMQALNWDAIKEVVGGRAHYEARFPGIKFELVCMTNATFNLYARTQAKINGVRLVERTEIERALKDPGFTFKDVDKFHT